MIFFFNDTATTEIYTLSLHDALPICPLHLRAREALVDGLQLLEADHVGLGGLQNLEQMVEALLDRVDRKSTRLNSSHANISYAVFCLKKKNILYLTIRYNIKVRHSSI